MIITVQASANTQPIISELVRVSERTLIRLYRNRNGFLRNHTARIPELHQGAFNERQGGPSPSHATAGVRRSPAPESQEPSGQSHSSYQRNLQLRPRLRRILRRAHQDENETYSKPRRWDSQRVLNKRLWCVKCVGDGRGVRGAGCGRRGYRAVTCPNQLTSCAGLVKRISS